MGADPQPGGNQPVFWRYCCSRPIDRSKSGMKSFPMGRKDGLVVVAAEGKIARLQATSPTSANSIVSAVESAFSGRW
jgi:hypothetical protein